MGVTVEFTTPDWDDHHRRQLGRPLGHERRLDDDHGRPPEDPRLQRARTTTRPPRWRPATASGITTLDGLAGKTVCVGRVDDLPRLAQRHEARLRHLSPTTTPPAGVKVDDPEDRRRLRRSCGPSGRNDFEGWLSSSTTVDAGDQGRACRSSRSATRSTPSRSRSALDKSGPDPTDFLAELNEIIDEMHADGTLTALLGEVVRTWT